MGLSLAGQAGSSKINYEALHAYQSDLGSQSAAPTLPHHPHHAQRLGGQVTSDGTPSASRPRVGDLAAMALSADHPVLGGARDRVAFVDLPL